MAIELQTLYDAICDDYDVKLLTNSCFDQKIEWLHVIDDVNFTYLLNGGELIFNSLGNYTSDANFRNFIDQLIEKKAGGLVVSRDSLSAVSERTIEYCNEKQFPLIWTSWTTSFMEIIRIFSELILDSERKETNLIAALQNAIYYPENEKLYFSQFEKNHCTKKTSYTMAVMSYHGVSEEEAKSQRRLLSKSLRYALKDYIAYEEDQQIIILVMELSADKLEELFKANYDGREHVVIGIGSQQEKLKNLHHSYTHAIAAYHLAVKDQAPHIVNYKSLGVYRLLTNVQDASVNRDFANDVLGKLIEYDKVNHAHYINLLELFFENDCNVQRTADAAFCHKNTFYNRLTTIQNILGFDILSNENRMKIMLAFHILKIE